MISLRELLVFAMRNCFDGADHSMEFHLEPHRPERGDLMRHARLDQPWCICRIEDALGNRVEHPVEQPALQHMDQPPGAGRGSV